MRMTDDRIVAHRIRDSGPCASTSVRRACVPRPCSAAAAPCREFDRRCGCPPARHRQTTGMRTSRRCHGHRRAFAAARQAGRDRPEHAAERHGDQQRAHRSQGATRLEDALRNVPGITLNAGEGAARGDTVNIRGFSAFNDFFIDGIRDAAVYTRDIFDADAVEVLEGPSAVLFGRGSTGGAINQVTKAPLLTPLESVTSIIGSNDLIRATGDFDMPFGTAAALRLNVMGESSRERRSRLRQESPLGHRAGDGIRHRRAGFADVHLPAPA